MNFQNKNAHIFVPDGINIEGAIKRTTHLGVGAHQDDLEVLAIDGILECFQQKEKWFTGVVVTNGAGSPRSGLYKDYTNQEMQVVRAKEQIQAAKVGEYAAQIQLDYSSAVVKDFTQIDVYTDISTIIRKAQPEIVYTHNLADKHPTHVAVALNTIKAIRSLPKDQHPKALYGCEFWRDLDWICEQDKIVFDCSRNEDLQKALLGVYESQVSGGKRYDLAVMGRRRANATFSASHDVDIATGITYAMDLTPMIRNPTLDIQGYVSSFIDRFGNDVREQLAGY